MGIMSLFTDPGSAIVEAKKSKSIGNSIGVLLLIGLLLAVSTAASMLFTNPRSTLSASYSGGYYEDYYAGPYVTNAGPVLISAAAVFAIVFLGGLFAGYLIMTAMRTLGGSGGFGEGLTAVAYSLFIPGIAMFVNGILVSSAVLSRSGSAMILAMFLGGALMLWGAVIGFATLYRSLKELFSTDMITAFVGATVLTIAGMVVIWQSMMSVMMYAFMPMM
jgi:hypothetical protein